MTPGRLPVRVKLNQYDDDWTIIFSLYTDSGNFTLESGTTAKIRGTKRDGLGYSANAAVDIANKTVTVAGDKQITAVSGENTFEIVLYKGQKELSTANVVFFVEQAAMDAETLISDSQVQEILDMSADVIAASENLDSLRGDISDVNKNLINGIKGVAITADVPLQNNDFQSGTYSTNGSIISNSGRAYCIYYPVEKGSYCSFNSDKWAVNYYYVNSPEDLTFIYSPNSWDESGLIKLDYNNNGCVILIVKSKTGTVNLTNRLNEINRDLFVFNNADTSIKYNGVVSGPTLQSNDKIGYYSVMSSVHEPLSSMTDVPVDNFSGGYLLNTRVGKSGTAIMQTLVEINTANTKGRKFSRVGNDQFIRDQKISWVAYGDSITNGSYSDSSGTHNSQYAGYAYKIANSIKRDTVSKFYNCGVRGIGWINTGNKGETFDDMLALYSGDKTEINLVTFALGINDYLSGEHIGTTESTEKDGTISGNIRYGLRWASENFPNAKIVVISPMNSTKHGNIGNGWSRNVRLTYPGTLQEVCDMIKYWCEYFGIKYINILTEGIVNTYNAQSMLPDGIHPTLNGQWLLAYDLADRIGI